MGPTFKGYDVTFSENFEIFTAAKVRIPLFC